MKKECEPVRIFCIRKPWWTPALTACAALLMLSVVVRPPFWKTAVTTR